MPGNDNASDVEPQRKDTGISPVRSSWTDSESPSIAVVEAVAAVTGREPTDLPPLADRLDTDALDGLVAEEAPGWDLPVSVSFEYAGVDVTIHGEGDLEVRRVDEPAAAEVATPVTATEFQERLERVVRSAVRNGVPVEGGWDCEGSAGEPAWDVHITSVSARHDGGERH